MPKRIVLQRRPAANEAVTLSCFRVEDDGVVDAAVADGNVLVQTLFLSVDPLQRCMFNADTGVDYVNPFQLGETLCGAGVGVVVASKADHLPAGTLVGGNTLSYPWTSQWSVPAAEAPSSLPAALGLTEHTASHALGVLGLTGLTAFFGLTAHAKVQAHDVLVVSSAAGATGTVAVQIAKIIGCTVVGLTSTDEKCDVVRSLGADGVVNYRTAMREGSLGDRILEAT